MAVSTTSPNVENYSLGKGIIYWKGDGETDFRDVGNVPEVEVTLTSDILDHFSSRQGIRTKDRSIVREKSGTVRFVMEEVTPANLGLMLMGSASAAVVNLSTNADIVSGSRAVTNIVDVTGLVTGRRYNISGTGIPANTTMVYDGANAGTLDANATASSPTGGTAVTFTGGIAIEIFALSEIVGQLRYVGTNDVGPKVTLDLKNVSIRPSGSFSPISEEWLQMEVTGEILVDDLDQFGHAYWNTTGAGV